MLTVEQNIRITQTGADTSMGQLLRRYWHPIAPSAELSEENPTKEVRLMSEDLVLFRSTAGKIGLIEPSCPHRKANLSYGVPEPEGIRCAYHGWLFDETGACIDQPSEPAGSRFKDKVKMKAYPVEEFAGLIWAYMGPLPAPILPKWDALTWEDAWRDMYYCVLPCNWLQCQENSLDPVHFEWLHRYWGGWVQNKRLPETERAIWDAQTLPRGRHQVKVGFDRFEYGIIKRRLLEGESEQDEWWRIGHPIIFPNLLRVGEAHPTEAGWVHAFQMRVPIDDTHTLHIVHRNFLPRPGVTYAKQDPTQIPWEERAVFDDQGKPLNTWVVGQDQSAWITQGAISDRATEALGVTDVGIIMFRNLIEEQIRIVEEGGEPMNVHRVDKGPISLPQEYSHYPGYDQTGGPFADQPNLKPDLVANLSDEAGSQL
jgi:5,5'-dehydrodivanillate O-demethylase oxygenase subunit